MTINNTDNITKLPLDNAAKIYTAAMSKKWNSVFAVSAYIKSDVNVLALKKAVNDLYKRFPSFYVVLKKEFFWDCFVPCTDTDIVEAEKASPCREFDMREKNKPLFRVVYGKREIRCEFFHSITDGTGATQYLKALLYQYFVNCKKTCGGAEEIKTVNQPWLSEEIADDFRTNYVKHLKASRSDTNAYQIKLDKQVNYLSRTQICIPIDEISYLAKHKYNCTITQLVSSIYALSLFEEYKKDKKSNKPVKLSIPVNLRKFYDSQTLRNFSSYITVNVTPQGDCTLAKTVEMIKSQMKQKITKDNFTAMISQNVADEEMAISKYSPNFIKRLVLKAAFYLYGEMKYSSTVTNTGYVKLPLFMSNEIDYICVTLGATAINKINCAVSGFENTLCVTITSVSNDMSIQNTFKKILADLDIQYKISQSCAPPKNNKEVC